MLCCLACAAPASVLCDSCRRSVERAPARSVGSIVVTPAFRHRGAAARLVHNLKYRRCRASAQLLGTAMAARIPDTATCVVPVPRSIARRIRYGVDQTSLLAAVVSAECGLPVVRSIRAPLWWRRRAGLHRRGRRPIPFAARRPLPRGAVIVDDVITTGSTIASIASTSLHTDFTVVTATAAGGVGRYYGTEGRP